VSEVPEPLRRLNVVLEAMFIAHETIYGLHHGLVSADQATARSQSLLAESARIVLQSAPEASAPARGAEAQLASRKAAVCSYRTASLRAPVR
jgi:hypothetical protein